ncbi:hypothetical protein U1Q18_004297 [Sarracenia purpurea var. burkii]
MRSRRSDDATRMRARRSNDTARQLRARRSDGIARMRARRSDDTARRLIARRSDVLGRSTTGRRKSTWAWPPYKAAERSTSCRIPSAIYLVASEDYGYRNLVFFLPRSKPSSVKVARTRKSFLLLRSRDWGFVVG